MLWQFWAELLLEYAEYKIEGITPAKERVLLVVLSRRLALKNLCLSFLIELTDVDIMLEILRIN